MNEAINDQSNVITFLPPLVFNQHFIENFVQEKPPCAALGIVETKGQEKGFIAIKTENDMGDHQGGFDLGTQLLGSDDFAMLHLVLNFNQDNIYDIVLNLNSDVTKRVLKVWEKTGDHFFFVFNDGGGLIAFSQEIGQAWYDYSYFEKIGNAKNSTSRYDRAVQAFKKSKMQHGIFLNLCFQDNPDFLDLTEQRFEVKSSYRR